MKLLVVDDDDDVREALAEALAELGASVTTARGGQEAIDTMATGLVPDLVVLDLMMPRVSGWNVWDWLRASPQYREVPVLVVTGSGLTQGALGEARVIKKGLGIEEIAEAILDTIESWP